ncbi:MAG: FliH/SctL family protein [Butyricicoccus sp.]|nr:FliH/SctL family protein [Butyricicoccus sp.]
MPNVFKAFSRARKAVESYQFPNAEDLVVDDEPEFAPQFEPETDEQAKPEPSEESEPEQEENAVSYAQIQADKILAEARANAEQIKEKARLDAEIKAQEVFAAAREDGYREGYAHGMTKAMEEGKRQSEEQAARLEGEVSSFLDKAGRELDRYMDSFVPDLRDLSMAVAEKVICISLKSSADVISRMIQTAIDKRKRREWVHIYIAECDAKRLTQMPASLTSALSALSDRVRIIPMADDESGTCIIEMPDEIIDASAATQMQNLRTILMDTANSSSGADLTVGLNFR